MKERNRSLSRFAGHCYEFGRESERERGKEGTEKRRYYYSLANTYTAASNGHESSASRSPCQQQQQQRLRSWSSSRMSHVSCCFSGDSPFSHSPPLSPAILSFTLLSLSHNHSSCSILILSHSLSPSFSLPFPLE